MVVYGILGKTIEIVTYNNGYVPKDGEIRMLTRRPSPHHTADEKGEWVSPTKQKK